MARFSPISLIGVYMSTKHSTLWTLMAQRLKIDQLKPEVPYTYMKSMRRSKIANFRAIQQILVEEA